MQNLQRSAAFLKRRKLLIVLPLMMLPFIIILFLLLGGGKNGASSVNKQKQRGLNLRLPDAHFLRKKEPDKLDLYDESRKDSDKLKMALQNDPYQMNSAKPIYPDPEKLATIKNIFEHSANQFPPEDSTAKKANELMEKLSKLKSRLNNPSPVDSQYLAKDERKSASSSIQKIPDLRENGNGNDEGDPELDQLNKMLDKVMAIQHPESIPDFRTAKPSGPESLPYAVSVNKNSNEPEWFGNREAKDTMDVGKKNWFYGLAGDQPIEEEPDNAIQAVVPESQTLVSGSIIKLRLLTGIRINGDVIPKDQFIYGVCSMHNERLEIRFSSIRCANSILPVSLEAYDLDGLAGIFIPGSITRDAVKQTGDQAISSLGLATLNPSIGAQAATAGIQTAKTLLSHKAKLIKVAVRAGYQLLLKDDRQ